MRILLTNDDGIDAPGLLAVASALAADGHDLSVAAPASDRSGSGSGLGSIAHGAEIAVTEHTLRGLPGVPAVSVDAPPAFAVLASCTGVLGPRPDIVVSGINEGFNTGRLILTSSTVGAVLMAGSLGVRGLAISAGFAPDHRYDTAAEVGAAMVAWLMEHSAPRTVLNLNVPNVSIDELRGVVTAPLSPRSLMGLRLERSEGAVRLHRFENVDRLGTDTDSSLVLEGYAAVSFLTTTTAQHHEPDTDPAASIREALHRRSHAVGERTGT